MSTNRTKTDWAYRQAERIVQLVQSGCANSATLRRAIARVLRPAAKRGQQIERNAQGLRQSLPRLAPNSCPHGLTDANQCGECLLDVR